MTIDPKVMQLVSKTLGLGDGGLVADSEGAALAYKFTSQQAADKAVDALEGIRGAAFNVADTRRESDGTYKVVMYEGNFNVITTFKSSEVEVAKQGLSEAMTLDRNSIAANDKKFAALQAAVNPKNLSFESREDADGMNARINRFIPVNMGSLDNLSTVQKSPDGRWVVEFNKAQVGKYSRTVDDIAKDVTAFRQALDKQTDNQKPSMQALSSGLGVGIRMDGDVNSFKMEGIPEGKMDELVAKLNTISPGMAEKAEGRIVIREEKLAEQRFDHYTKLPIEQPALKVDFRDLPIDKQAVLAEAKEMISANYVELLNKSKFSNNNGWATTTYGSDNQTVFFDQTKGFATREEAEAEAQKLSGEFKLTAMNGFTGRKIGDKYYATISQRSMQLEGGAKAIAEANAAAAAVVPPPPMLPVAPEAAVAAPPAPATTPAAETPPATPPVAAPAAVPNPAAPAAETPVAPSAPTPTVTPSPAPAAGAAGTAGTVTAPTPSAPTPPPEDTVGNNLFTIIGAAIPALLMLAGGVDVGLGLLLLLGGMFLGGMFDKPKGGFVGKMVDNVMGKDGPSLGGMDIDKSQNLTKDELAKGLDKNKDNKLDAREIGALSQAEQQKLFAMLQANDADKADADKAMKLKEGKMEEVDLNKITAPVNLPAAPTPGTGTGTPGK